VTAEPGWFYDPSGAHELRYWDGEEWTDHVADGGARSRAPMETVEMPPSPGPAAPSTSSAQLGALFRIRWLIVAALLFIGIPLLVAVVVAVSLGSHRAAVEPFDNPDAACEAWWQANVAAAREGWEDARFRQELRRLAEATEPVDAQLATQVRVIASADDAALVRDNSQAAYQRCVGVHYWRGATDAELSILANPSRPPR
jgi:hypothetical protein